MPLFDGTVSSSGLPKPLDMSNYHGKHMLPYNGAYYAYDPQGKNRAQFTSPLSDSKTSLLDGRRGVSHLSGMETEHNAFYRQDSTSSTEGHSNRSLSPLAPVKQGFKLYTKSPGISSSAAATLVAVRNPKTGSETSSPLSENQSYLAIPKPVYAHNPCCDDMGCVRGQYSREPAFPGMPTAVRKPHWVQTDPRYKENSAFQKKTGDTVLQRGALQFEPSAGRLQRIPVEYSPGGAAPYAAVIEPNYKSYPSSLFRTHFGSLSEQSEQTSPRGYPCLYPSHYTYEHKTSDVYQEHSPMAKYGHLTQRPMFYCTQPDVEVESRAAHKDNRSQTREDVPIILKHTVQCPQEHYGSPGLRHVDVPFPFACTDTPPNPALLQGLGLHYYAIPRFHSDAIQCTAPLQKQDTSSDRANDSSSGFCIDYSKFSVTNINHGSTLLVDPARPSTPDRAVPTRRTSEPDVSPKTQNNGHCAPHGLLNVGRYKDYSSCETNVSPRTRQTFLPHDRSDETNSVIQKGLNVRKIIYSPPVSPERKHNVKFPFTSSGLKVAPKRSISCSVSPVEIKKEREEILDEVEFPKKPKKVETKIAKLRSASQSPPMPVISDVFSLAPYKAQLQVYEGSIAGTVPPKPIRSDHCESQSKRDNSEKRIGEDKEQLVCQEKPIEGIVEAKNIKLEEDLSNKDVCEKKSVCQEDYSKVAIKKEWKESSSSDCGHILGLNKGDPGTLEKPNTFADQKQTAEVSIPVKVRAQIDPPPVEKTSTPQKQAVKPRPTTPPPPSNTKADFKNIPPHCLKLTTFTILLPDVKPSSSARPPENPSTTATERNIPKPGPQIPVRKHFFELHHSLYKLINKSVFASSEEALKTWLSQLDLAETPSPHGKATKVSCLLGVKARLLWFNEEIKSALQDLLQRLNEYIVQDRCPFPHVIRAGAVFLPMLVMKEQLFPMVQSNYIDQVLQEHKIELRPATLSEEKILIQLHKRPCSSRLRKLMSLKHLPDIYADVANVLYYCCVTKYLESSSPDVIKKAKD